MGQRAAVGTYNYMNESILCSQVSKKHVKKETSREIHEKAAPFVDWLRTAEEESSDEEEENEVEVVYSKNQTGASIVAQPQETPQQVTRRVSLFLLLWGEGGGGLYHVCACYLSLFTSHSKRMILISMLSEYFLLDIDSDVSLTQLRS